MDELCRKYNFVRANRVQNSNLTFDFSSASIEGVFVMFFCIMLVVTFCDKNYKLLLFDIILIIFFAIVKLQIKKLKIQKNGFVSFNGNSIIIKSLFGNKIIDCTKGIVIYIYKQEHKRSIVHPEDDWQFEMIDKIFGEKNITYKLVVSYKDEYEMEQKIVLASTNSDNSADEFEKFITNFYYEEEPKEKNEKSEQNTIRFCM